MNKYRFEDDPYHVEQDESHPLAPSGTHFEGIPANDADDPRNDPEWTEDDEEVE